MPRRAAIDVSQRAGDALTRSSASYADAGANGESSSSGRCPQRLAVVAPGDGDLPPRQRLARVPLALAVMHHPARGVVRGQRLRPAVPPARACRHRRRRCSIPAWSCPWPTRRSARRPWSIARRPRPGARRPHRPELEDALPLRLGVGLGAAGRVGEPPHACWRTSARPVHRRCGCRSRERRRRSAGWPPAECAPRRRTGPTSHRGRPSPRRAGTPRPTRADR